MAANKLPSTDHSDRRLGLGIYWHAKSQRPTRIFCSRFVIKIQLVVGNLLLSRRIPVESPCLGSTSQNYLCR
jgi:hypothetical protein